MFGKSWPESALNRRRVLTMGGIALLAGCQIVPKGVPDHAPPPPVADVPNANVLPSDAQRHRVALLVPMSGPDSGVGQAIANATTMALLDTNAQSLRITTYDTAGGAQAAATRAIADGNRLILGPIASRDVTAVAAVAGPAHVPIISYSNDERLAAGGIFVMGSPPVQSIARSVEHLRHGGMTRFAALIPTGDYGRMAAAGLQEVLRDLGGKLVGIETYDRGNTSIASAARRLQTKGGYDAVLIADGPRISAFAAPALRTPGAPGPKLIGTELWSGEAAVGASLALRGAVFSTVSDSRWRQFAESYKTRFGAQPYRLATLGYDSVLLSLRVARDWRPGTNFPLAHLADQSGFLGLDGPFRFDRNGVIERALEVREARAGGVTVISPAPGKFAN